MTGWPDEVYSTGIGTPHTRCREMHQKGLFCTCEINPAVSLSGMMFTLVNASYNIKVE